MELIILSQQTCPKCVGLKNYLKQGLDLDYKEIMLEENPEKFRELVAKFGVRTTPVLIKGEEFLIDCSPSKVNDFLGL